MGVDADDADRGDPSLFRQLHPVPHLHEALLAEQLRRDPSRPARRAPCSKEAAAVPELPEEPFPRDPARVDVVRLDVPGPVAVRPRVPGPLRDRHPSPSRSGRKYTMSRTLPTRSLGARHFAFTRMPIRISSFDISPK